MQPDPKLRTFQRWFMAAAIYNVVWGAAAIVFPIRILQMVGITDFRYPSFFQCIGMMVLVYAPGYYLLARNPVRYAPFAWIGLIGKTLGPIGFLWAALRGELPWSFGFNLLFNDLMWWPAFWGFVLRYARNAA